ncbi:MAG: outer membrane protein [Flavobacteriaceae bacterium]|jgi:outer membrane protein
MKNIILPILVVLLSVTSFSQEVKIGYTNIELILAYMPETKEIKKKITNFSEEQSSVLSVLKNEIIGQKKQRDRPGIKEADIALFNDQITQMESKFNAREASLEDALITLESDLYNPVYKKISKAIENVRVANGYSMILNKTNTLENSPVLAASEKLDITNDVLKILGVER